MFSEPTPRMTALKSEVHTHVSLLTQISDSINLKYSEIIAGTQINNPRNKRGVLNGIGTIWKSITGNLDATDGQYYNDCINKLTNDEHQIENLVKNQISVTTSVIKNFNTTIQKLQIDEETFNKNLIEIQTTLSNISNDLSYYEAQIKLLEICETLMESFVFVKDALDNVLNAIAFARLKILHNSIIIPDDLIDSLQLISQSLKRNNLPLPIFVSNIAQYLDIIELGAYQMDSKIVFILKIPLVEPETYTLYRLYPIPILDNRTGLYHILPTAQKYVARDEDSLFYISMRDLTKCKSLDQNTKICSSLLPYPIDSDSICEAQLLRRSSQLPRTCQTTLLIAKEYYVQEIVPDTWLIAISDPLPVTIKCENMDATTRIINNNSILSLQAQCSAFIGSTRVHSRQQTDFKEIVYKTHPVQIPFSCCDHLPATRKVPNLKPLKLSKIDVEDLNIAQHKLNQYSEELDKIINEPYISKEISWFSITTIILIVLAIIIYVFYRCKRKHRPTRTFSNNPGDDPPLPPTSTTNERFQINPRRLINRRRRASIQLGEPLEEVVEMDDVKI